MNLYVHFPFCRRKCRYCALHSRVGVPAADRDAYVRRLAAFLATLPEGLDDDEALLRAFQIEDKRQTTNDKRPDAPSPDSPDLHGHPIRSTLSTVYFGGGSPALCDLRPIFAALAPRLTPETEFSIEIHPLDVTDDLLATLRDNGVNRISMGVQSLDDATLAAMERGYTIAEAARAFVRVKRVFDNAGIDLIVGYPGDPCSDYSPLADWGLAHCSVYSLQNERNLKGVPDDDWTLDRLRETAAFLASIGLERYEISNYALPGRTCRHNLAVWRGEDYLGLGEGACGRVGRCRTRNLGAPPPAVPEAEEVTVERDALERRIFRLRTREGLDASDRPDWEPILAAHVANGLLTKEGGICRLTQRGMEVCDSILADLV